MIEKNNVEIVEVYHEGLASPLAEMFNSWDELWPGGFLDGVPYTAERVHRWLNPMRAISILIAMEQGKPVGFLPLHSLWRDPEAAYVGLLGVSPDVVGKKVGKRLLLRSMAIAAQQGYRRVDLYTWAGNLSAVPLYKKAGFMWNPDTEGVYMQSYIPAILNHPLCIPFFERHPDETAWYDLQRRYLTQIPDEMTQKGMDVFIYTFEGGEDLLRVSVDRYARAITGVERVLDGKRLRIDAGVARHQTLCGLPEAYRLEVENGTDEDIVLSLSMNGFEGLHFEGEPQSLLKAPAGKSVTWTVPFRLDTSAPLYRKELKSPAITATLKTDEQGFTLATGMKIKSAAEIHTQFGECRVVPGAVTPLPIAITSNASTELRGELRFDLADLPIMVSPMVSNIQMTPAGLAGVIAEVAAPDDLAPGTYDLWASLHFESDGNEGVAITTRRFRIPIFCIPSGAVAVGKDDLKKEVIVVGADYTAHLSREGGKVKITASSAAFPKINLQTEIGPPFGLDPFRETEREVDITICNSSTTVSLIARHPERPLRVETRLLFTNNSPVICQEIWMTNQGTDDQMLQLRVDGYSGGIGLMTERVIIPLASGIVYHRAASNLSNYASIPDDPKTFSEGWIALVSKACATGQAWESEELEEIQISHGRIGRLGYRTVTLRPGEERRLSRIWHITRTDDWKSVRRLWQEKVAHHIPLESESAALPDAVPLLRIAPPPIILPHRKPAAGEFTFHYPATALLSGPLSVEAPPGWSASLNREGMDGSDKEIALTDVNGENLPALRLTITPGEDVPDRFAVFTGQMTWHTPVQVNQSFPIVQLGSEQNIIEISEGEEESLSVFRVRNGLIEFAVSPDYGGCLFSLKNRHSTELLSSAFPAPKPKDFLQNYWGGVQPIISGADKDSFSAKTNMEKMQARVCTQGTVWKGVEVSWQGKLQPDCSGVEFKLCYLTAPGSPLILIDWTISNATTAPLRLIPVLLVDVAFNNDLSNSILQARWDGDLTDVRQSVPATFFATDTNFAWLRRQREGLALLAAGTKPKMSAVYLNAAVWLTVSDPHLWLHPGEERTLRSCIMIDPTDSATIETIQRLLGDL